MDVALRDIEYCALNGTTERGTSVEDFLVNNLAQSELSNAKKPNDGILNPAKR